MQRVWSPGTARHQVRVDAVDGALGEGRRASSLVAGLEKLETMDFSGPFNYGGGCKHMDLEHGKSCCHRLSVFFSHENPDITWRQDALKLKTKLYDPFPGALSSSKFQVVTTLPISAWEDFRMPCLKVFCWFQRILFGLASARASRSQMPGGPWTELAE